MALEIERKYLITGKAWKNGEPVQYSQGYLSVTPERTVRVRLAPDKAWLTVKGKTIGMTRIEFEYEIPRDDALEMLELSETPILVKNRYHVNHRGKLWEVDEFLGDNAGLVIAEIELDDESEVFGMPEWAGREVTDDPRYFNSNLTIDPFTRWENR